VDGVVNVSEVRAVRTSSVPVYFAYVVAIYLVNGREYTVKHSFAKKGGMAPYDQEMVVSNYPLGTGVTVCYHPKNPQRAWVDEWDAGYTKRKLKAFKQRPEVRKVLSRRYRSRMLTGILWLVGGIVASIIVSIIGQSFGFLYIAFTGAIIFGIISFLSGLFGWLKYLG
jgi:hypothetical protein